METTKPTIDPPFTVLSGPCFKTNVWRGKIAREDLIMETLAHAQNFAPRSFRLSKGEVEHTSSLCESWSFRYLKKNT